MPDAFFDIVIIGTDLAGLAYGALCAKHGYTVLLVGQDARPAIYKVGQAQMFREIPLFYGFSSSLVLRSFFRDIGLLAEMRNRPVKLDPFLQIASPGSRFELSESRQGNRDELERAFNGAGDGLMRFIEDACRDAKEMDRFLDELPLLPAAGFWGKHKLRRYLSRHDVFIHGMDPLVFPSELRFSSPLTALLLFLSRLHARPLAPFSVRRFLQHIMAGFYEFPQGIDGLKRLFTERILANGGAYWPERSVEQILLKGRKNADSVTIHRPRRTVGLRLLVGNCPPRSFFSLIPQEQQNPQFHAAIKSMKPAYYNYIVNFAVRADLIPESMGRNLLLSMYPRQEASGPNVLWVYTRLPENYEGDTPATIAVTCRIEARQLPLARADFDRLNERILQSLEWILPFIREKLVKVHTPYITVDRDTDEEKLDASEVREIFDEPYPGCLDLSALPCRTFYKNILIVGDHYLGSLGLEGSVMGARQAFGWTQESVVLKQILRK